MKRFEPGEIAAQLLLLLFAAAVLLSFIAPALSAAIDRWNSPWLW